MAMDISQVHSKCRKAMTGLLPYFDNDEGEDCELS